MRESLRVVVVDLSLCCTLRDLVLDTVLNSVVVSVERKGIDAFVKKIRACHYIACHRMVDHHLTVSDFAACDHDSWRVNTVGNSGTKLEFSVHKHFS